MNRKNIDKTRFVDLDELSILEVRELSYIDNSNPDKIELKKHFRVDGVTKSGLTVESLFVDTQSQSDKLCLNFITTHWLNSKK